MSKISIDWRPDRSSSVPVYKQIIDYMSMKISTGDWAVGSRLPAQRQLAKQFNVNRSTIVTAMDELSSYGVLESDFGKGTYVASNTWSLMMTDAPPDWSRYIQSGSFHASDPIIQECRRCEADPRFISLGTGQLSPSLFPREEMSRAMERVAGKLSALNYQEPLGLPALRRSVARRLQRDGIDISPSCILITSGALQALQLICLTMLKSGSTVFTGDPSYLKSLQFFQSAGMNLSGLPMDQEGLVYWQIDPERIQREEALLYAIPDFHNPTGTVMSADRRKALFRFCQQNHLPIIEDASYRELWYDEKPPATLKSMDKNGMVLHIGTVSKTLAPGLRTGWIAGPESVIHRLADMKMQMDSGASTVSQLILAEFFSSGAYDKYLPQLRVQLKSRRDTVVAALERNFSQIASWDAPAGGFYVWLRFDENLSARQLFRAAVREHILLFPGTLYEYGKSCSLRISYAYAEEREILYALARLSRIVRSMM
ncbi:aminotransferase-like domain-containing protein [Bacilliculturomica massiliensis]|uniref:aminotransferase-like domain-containing protein n=1 Tax=Bacilliculturomica massiliensis TaxID=1917867 RepID=UPI001030EDFA|nr:PLP-dependent aminotransferase family protein [Bacilliculturomica massiliensis]